jgi:hypothetical protein
MPNSRLGWVGMQLLLGVALFVAIDQLLFSSLL